MVTLITTAVLLSLLTEKATARKIVLYIHMMRKCYSYDASDAASDACYCFNNIQSYYAALRKYKNMSVNMY
jgi:hypothetical protein